LINPHSQVIHIPGCFTGRWGYLLGICKSATSKDFQPLIVQLFPGQLSTITIAKIAHPHKIVYKPGNKKLTAAFTRFQFSGSIYPQEL
jgi:hypothetical protein